MIDKPEIDPGLQASFGQRLNELEKEFGVRINIVSRLEVVKEPKEEEAKPEKPKKKK